MNVLSLFDGISGAQLALQKTGIHINNYFASEIDSHCIDITQFHFPNTIQLGDVRKIDISKLPKIDLLIGGSPCQNLSNTMGSYRTGLQGSHSSLFYYFRDIKRQLNCSFLLENVASMGYVKRHEISQEIDVKRGVVIDAALVSGQVRKRVFWSSFSFPQPKNQDISLQSLLEKDASIEYLRQFKANRTPSRDVMRIKCHNITNAYKSRTILVKQDRFPNAGIIDFEDYYRFLSPIECERLQGFPDNYTFGRTAQRYKAIGNSFNIDVISHILEYLP